MAYNSNAQRMINRHYPDPSVNYFLAPGDKLVNCPYYNHKILESRFTTHLSKCMTQYKKQLEQNPRLTRFKICTDNWQHHIPESEFKDHIEVCPDALKRKVQLENEKLEDAKLRQIELVTAVEKEFLQDSKIKPLQSKKFKEEDSSSEAASTYSAKGAAISVFEEDEMFNDPITKSDSIIGSDQVSLTDVKTSASTNLTNTAESAKGNVLVQTRLPVASEDWDKESKDLMNSMGPDQPFYDPKAVLESKHIYYIPPGMSKSERVAYRKKVASLFKNGSDASDKTTVSDNLPATNPWMQPVALPPSSTLKNSSAGSVISYTGHETNLYDYDYKPNKKK